MSWQQMKPSLADVNASNIERAVGSVWPVKDNRLNYETRGNVANVCILGVATREDYIKQWGKEPPPGHPYSYWTVED